MSFSSPMVYGFILAFARASAWIVLVPPFSNKAIPAMAKVGLAAGLGLAAAGSAAPTGELTWPQLMAGVGLQVVAGLVLGFLVMLILGAAQAAGGLIGLFGGLSLPPQLDPLSLNQSTPTSALYEMIAMALLFASNGHVILTRGFLASFSATQPVNPAAAASTLTHAMTTFFVGALEISAPLLAVLFASQMVLGLVSKASPQMNAMSLSFPIQITAVLALLGVGITILPGAVGQLLHQATSNAPALFGLGH
ncbi:flagellar biosynthetic protein FliR [Acidothermaceae bacterium B102]|nr:flagellar biosynthetic protein FliR [Acidothermaceae bacterium B102]